MTTVLLIRHGETDWNVQGLYQGTSDIPLDAVGEEQAILLAESMRGEAWDFMASSPLSRAWETAMTLADAIDYPRDDVVADDRMMERHFGEAEGLTLAERMERFPDDDWPGLESWEDLIARSVGALNDHAAAHPGQRIILVAHGTWINSILGEVSGGEYGHGKTVLVNTSRTLLEGEPGSWSVVFAGEADHLGVTT